MSEEIAKIQNEIDRIKAQKWHAITLEVDEKKIEAMTKKMCLLYMRLCVLLQKGVA